MSRHLGWLAAAAVLGFAVPASFSGVLGLERDPYLLVYLPVMGAFTAAYLARHAPADWTRVRGRWLRGAAVGLAAGALLVLSILRQPAGARADGAALLLDLAWSGVAYGVVDALLLTVLPVAAVVGALGGSAGRAAGRDGGGASDGTADGEGGARGSAAATAALALAASLAVTAAYHLGYEEFRGAAVAGPLVGNAVVTVAHLAARSPVAPVVAHVTMHVAAVLHGMEAAAQLPPHG